MDKENSIEIAVVASDQSVSLIDYLREHSLETARSDPMEADGATIIVILALSTASINFVNSIIGMSKSKKDIIRIDGKNYPLKVENRDKILQALIDIEKDVGKNN